MVKIPSTNTIRDKLPLRAIIIAAMMLAVAIAVVLGLTAYLDRVNAQRVEKDREQAQALVDEIARSLASRIAPIRAGLAKLSQSSEIVAGMADDRPARQAEANKHVQSIDGALLLRLLPEGSTRIDRTSSPPLTFASIDMLRTSRDNDRQIPVELHLNGTANEHMVMIERVFDGERLAGFLHLSLSAEVIRKAVEDLSPETGYIEVRQRASSGPPVIVARHGTPPSGQVNAIISGIPGTAFVASYRLVPSGGTSVQIPLMPLLAIVGVALLLGLIRVFAKRRKGGVAAGDAEFQGAIKAILDGALPGLEQLLPGSKGAVVVAAEIEPASDVNLDLDLDLDLDITGSEPSAAAQLEAASDSSSFEAVDHGPLEAGIEVTETSTDEFEAIIASKIFRSYDIRGVVGETLTPDGVYQIGRALGTEAEVRGQQTIVVARDGRNSSQELREALIEGLRDTGRDVLDIGLTPTPVLYFATHYLDSHSGVMVTGSHNPPEYNGLKIVLDGETLSGEAIQAIRKRVESKEFSSGEGTMQTMEIVPDYIRRISEEIPVTLGDALKVVVDCGNSVPGIVAPHILRAIGHDVIELYCEVDGNFPNHHPDPSQPENLADLIETVQEEDADIGLAFDGDGDRLGVVDNEGNIIWPDRQMILFARDVLSRNPGAKIIYDVKCSRVLADEIKAHGGEPIMSPSGHSLIKNKMQETGALLAGEMSGHIFFKDRWYGFDDALYSAARLLEILVESEKSPAEVFAGLPGGVATPELRLDMDEDRHQIFMDEVIGQADFGEAAVSTIDGLRVDFDNGWGLVRASNTTPCLVLRFEGDDDAALESIKERFRSLLMSVDGTLTLPF